MLWLSLALLLFGTALLARGLLPVQFTMAGPYEGRTAPPVASSSASLIDPGAIAGEASAIDDASSMDRDAPQRLDVRGNEIARPVARYRVDERGSSTRCTPRRPKCRA